MGSGVPRWLAVETLGLRLLQRSAEGRRGPFHGDSLAGGGYSGFPESPAEGGGRTLDLGAFPGTGLILGIPLSQPDRGMYRYCGLGREMAFRHLFGAKQTGWQWFCCFLNHIPARRLIRRNLSYRSGNTKYLPLSGGLTRVCKNEVTGTNRRRYPLIPACAGMTKISWQ